MDEGARTASAVPVVVATTLVVVIALVVALAQLPGPPVPFGCGGSWSELPGMYRRLAIQVAIAAILVLALVRMDAQSARSLLVALLVASTGLALLAWVYYAFDAGLRNELAGVPGCGGVWTQPPLHALFWSLPGLAVALDSVTTLVARMRRPRAWSVGWTLASVVVLGVAIAQSSMPVTA